MAKIVGRKPGAPKTGGKNWEKGQSGNPAGGQGIPMPNKLYKTLGVMEFKEIVALTFIAKRSELERVIADEDEPEIRRAVANVLLKASQEGDMRSIDLLLNRVIGKPKEVLEITGDKPSVLVMRDGTEVAFTYKRAQPREE